MDLLSPEIGLFIWTLVAFLFVLFILAKFAWKPILSSLGEREKGIADSISAAERMKIEMGQLHSENEKLLMQAREERTQMLRDAKEMKEKIVSEAKEQAKTEANKIIADAQVQIEHQKNVAVSQVRNEMGALAVQVAEKILRRQLATSEGQDGYLKLLADDITLN